MPQPTPEPAFWRDPALPFAEARRAQHSRACYRAHTHTTLSVGAVDAGSSTFSSGGGHTRLGAGSLVIVPAGCVHACNPAPGQAWSYQMLHLDAAWAAEVLQHRSHAGLPTHAQALHTPAAYDAFSTLMSTLFSDTPCERKAEALTHFVVDAPWHGGTPLVQAPARASAAVTRALEALHAHPFDPWPLPVLAQVAGLTPQALVRAMRAATGLTPHAYQLDLRINAARKRLCAGAPLAGVAHELGFYDQSHFHRSFRDRVAATPRRYQHG